MDDAAGPLESRSDADLAREFNRRLLIARITALQTVQELAAPRTPDPLDDPADRRITHSERALRLRAAAALLRQKPIDLDDPAVEDEADPPAGKTSSRQADPADPPVRDADEPGAAAQSTPLSHDAGDFRTPRPRHPATSPTATGTAHPPRAAPTAA